MRNLLGALCAVLMLVPALAGCLDDGGDGDATGTDEELIELALSFLPSVELVCPDYITYTALNQGDSSGCASFGEPQLEVAGDGTIWYSSVCCVGQSPPIWRSFDGGLTFEAMAFADGTGASRDALGVEGDFAIDDAGNVYFFDITAATAYITKYAADGTHIHTKPDAFPPLVDRPWVRAGAEDEVFIAYNTARSTQFYRSIDGAMTWDRVNFHEFPCPLMSLGQGPVRHHLIVAGCSGDPAAYISLDGGFTFGDRIDLPLGAEQVGTESYMQPAADAAGITYVPVTHTVEGSIGDRANDQISVFAIHPDGTVQGPFAVTPETGLVDKPWLIAGKEGVVAMAYYGADTVTRDEETEEAVWDLKIAYSLDADTAAPTWSITTAHDAVLNGTFGRNLGDFLQLRQAPDGDLVVAYASRPDGGALVNRFIRQDLGADFAPEVFRNGPEA